METVITNPLTKVQREYDLAMVTQEHCDAWVQLLDDDELRDCYIETDSPTEWAAHMIITLGPDRAGQIILGS